MTPFGCPSAVRQAFAPPPGALEAPALAHLLLLSLLADEEGCVPATHAFRALSLAAAKIAHSPARYADAIRQSPPLDVDPATLERAVDDALAAAFATNLPAAAPGGDAPPSGLGWWLELLHFAIADLHFGLKDALAVPLAELFALAAAGAAANGSRFTAPSYEEQDVLATLPVDGSLPEKGDEEVRQGGCQKQSGCRDGAFPTEGSNGDQANGGPDGKPAVNSLANGGNFHAPHLVTHPHPRQP